MISIQNKKCEILCNLLESLKESEVNPDMASRLSRLENEIEALIVRSASYDIDIHTIQVATLKVINFLQFNAF